jgi:hypothetical protein
LHYLKHNINNINRKSQSTNLLSYHPTSLIFEISDLMLSGWVLFLIYLNLFEIKDFVVVDHPTPSLILVVAQLVHILLWIIRNSTTKLFINFSRAQWIKKCFWSRYDIYFQNIKFINKFGTIKHIHKFIHYDRWKSTRSTHFIQFYI